MTLVVLVSAPEMNERVDAVIAFAEKPANHWPGSSGTPTDPRYIVHVGEYRCAYSITNYDGTKVRELSVGHVSGRPATPGVIRLLASFFGFTGTMGADWSVESVPAESATVALQLLETT